MAVTTYPGVYIEEFAPGAPIQGVGTSTAAFIGPTAKGDLRTPTKVTSLDQFHATFGAQPLPGFFLWYAVRAFFQNGGQVCYIVRASNGDYATSTLDNAGGHAIIQLRAREPGVPTPAIHLQVANSHVLDGSLYRPTANRTALSGRDMTVHSGEGARFRPGDWITLDELGERAQILRVIPGPNGDVLRLTADLVKTYKAAGSVRLADAPIGTRTLRIETATAPPPGALVAGTMLTFAQDPAHDTQFVDTVQVEPSTGPDVPTTYRVTLRQGLAIPLNFGSTVTVQSDEFSLTVMTVKQDGSQTPLASYENLSLDASHPRYVLAAINGSDGPLQATLVEPPPMDKPPANVPKDVNLTLGVPPASSPSADLTKSGQAEDLSGLTEVHYQDALDSLRIVRDVNLVAIPDATTLKTDQVTALQQALRDHCEQMGDRFAVLDARPGLTPFDPKTSIQTQRAGLDSPRGYAALYYPWLRTTSSDGKTSILVPPSGHVCGVMARSDAARGVHKAPANEIVRDASGVERSMSDVDQGQLNIAGINVIRVFRDGGAPVLWGARTTATDRNWQYVNVRRLFLFLEQSIEEGIRWAVFEPNNLQLWQKLKRSITAFLTSVWRDGALFGETADKAFYVRIDEVLNPFSEQALGRLHIEVGVRPAYPAEFIVLRIGIWQGGSDVSEG